MTTFTRTHRALVVLLVGIVLSFASSAPAGNGNGNGNKATQPNDTPPAGQDPSTPVETSTGTQLYTQTNFASGNSLDVNFSGANASTHGLNYQLDGVTLNYIDPITAGAGGATYTPKVVNGVTYMVEKVNKIQADGTIVEKETGTAYRVDTVSTGEKWVKVVPGVSMGTATVGQLTGTASTDPVGVTLDNTHNDSQVIGGVTNEQADRTTALNGLIAAIKESANTYVDMSTSNYTITGAGWGTAENPVLAYASGKRNADGTVTECDLKFSGQEKGYGVLVVEIDDPNNAQFEMSGQSLWTGLVVVVCNKNPTGNKEVLAFVGGGQDLHIIGGTFVYLRNKARAGETATLLQQAIVKLAGNGNIRFCDAAIGAAFKMKPTCMQVRSWRRLQENE